MAVLEEAGALAISSRIVQENSNKEEELEDDGEQEGVRQSGAASSATLLWHCCCCCCCGCTLGDCSMSVVNSWFLFCGRVILWVKKICFLVFVELFPSVWKMTNVRLFFFPVGWSYSRRICCWTVDHFSTLHWRRIDVGRGILSNVTARSEAKSNNMSIPICDEVTLLKFKNPKSPFIR